MQKIIVLILVISSFGLASAQSVQKPADSQHLKFLLDSIYRVKDDSLRAALNQVFFDQLNIIVSADKESADNLDSVKISNVVSEDGNIRILSWNIQQNNGNNIYSGFVINKLSGKIIPLKTVLSKPLIPIEKIYRDGDWPGGIIYRVIQRKYSSGTNYTLLIWDGFNRNTSRKSIEALSFDTTGNAVFGAPVFKIKEGVRNRIVYEYSANASFSLQYTRQKVMLTGVRKSRRNIDDQMIVLDRLIPLNEEMKDQRWAYVPAGNTNDAFIYYDEFWTLTEDIQARNEAAPDSKSKKPKTVELDLLPKENK